MFGCESAVPRWPSAPSGGTQARSWDVVFPGPATTERLASIDRTTLPEWSRNDKALAYRPPHARLASDQWPTDPRVSLERARRIQVDDHGNTSVFYFNEREYDRGGGGGGAIYPSWYPWW